MGCQYKVWPALFSSYLDDSEDEGEAMSPVKHPKIILPRIWTPKARNEMLMRISCHVEPETLTFSSFNFKLWKRWNCGTKQRLPKSYHLNWMKRSAAFKSILLTNGRKLTTPSTESETWMKPPCVSICQAIRPWIERGKKLCWLEQLDTKKPGSLLF